MQDSSSLWNLILYGALPVRIALDVAGLVNPMLSLNFANALLFGLVAIVIFVAGQLAPFAYLALCISAWYCVLAVRKRKAVCANPESATPHV